MNSSARAVSGIYTKPMARFTATCQREPSFWNPARGSSFCFHRRRDITILLHCNPAPFILKFAKHLQYKIMMGSYDARAGARAAVHLDLPAPLRRCCCAVHTSCDAESAQRSAVHVVFQMMMMGSDDDACNGALAATAREVNQKSPRPRPRVSQTENHDAETRAFGPRRRAGPKPDHCSARVRMGPSWRRRPKPQYQQLGRYDACPSPTHSLSNGATGPGRTSEY